MCGFRFWVIKNWACWESGVFGLTEELTEGFVDETPMQECTPSVVVLG